MALAFDTNDFNAWLDAGHGLRVQPHLEALRSAHTPGAWVCAARALRHLGAEREGDALSIRAGRRWPKDAAAQTSMLRSVLGRGGAYAFWRADQRWPLPAEAGSAERAERLSLQGLWLAQLRDTKAALDAQQRALRLSEHDAWLWVEHSYTLECLDRRDQALDAVNQALALQPQLRTAHQQQALLLWQMQRHDEAEALLVKAWDASGNGSLAWQLHGMASDRGRYEEALRWIEAAESALPLADKARRAAFTARRADTLLHLGRRAEAREEALKVPGQGYFSRLAERLADPAEKECRVQLPLEQITQHWNTCAPATLAALSRFWGREAEHLEIAEAICYDGTPYVAQRRWATEQGFLVREFKPDWISCCALIDAGIPFALGTQFVGSGHLQAVVGYDRLRGTLLIRDPSAWLHTEYEAASLFDEQWACGDRAMLLLPHELGTRLDGIELPQARDWDLGHAFDEALERHDRDAAQAALQELTQQSPQGERLLRVRRSMALYDGDEAEILAATEALLARFPGDVNLRLSRVTSLFEVRGQHEAEEQLRELVDARWPDPLVLVRWAGRLALDARRLPEALFHIRRALRRHGTQGRAWSELADRLWQQSDARAAIETSRWASSLLPTEEWAASSHARACRVAGQAEAGLAWLRERDRALGGRSGAPAITLAEELEALERQTEAEAVLNAALDRRPEDIPLRLALAERCLHRQRVGEAEALLRDCRDAAEPSLLRLRALCLELSGALEAAQQAVEQALRLSPLNLALHRLLLRLLRRQVGDAEALRRWRVLADARPAHVGLQRLLYDQLPVYEAQAREAQLARLHAYHPADDWLQRERAVHASRQGRHEDAIALAQGAFELAPKRAISHSVLAYCLWRRDGYEKALPHWQAALRIDAEFEPVLEAMFAAPDPAGRRAAADFAAAELRSQPLLGDGLLAFQRLAPGAWSDVEVLTLLQELTTAWPGLWQSGLALARQLGRMDRHSEAVAMLEACAQRFPLLPRVHLELAEALRSSGQLEAALLANTRAVALSPAWNRAVRQQVDLLGDTGGRWAEALAVVDRALADRHGFDDADLIGLRAWLLGCLKRDSEALVEVRRSLRGDPQAEWVWTLARQLCERAERLQDFDALLDEVVRSRPGDAVAWTVLGEQARDDSQALQALERALQLEPWRPSSWRERFRRLHRLSREDEILKLLETQRWRGGEEWPADLRAWRPRLHWARGQRAMATAELRSLCEAAHDDVELWRQLADWLDECGDGPGYLHAAEQLRALEPQHSRSHLYVGHALLRSGRASEALAPLQRALAQQPNYPFAAFALADASEASLQPLLGLPALDALWPTHRNVRCAARAIELAALGRDEPQAFAWLERLMELDEFELQRCEAALQGLVAAGWKRRLGQRQRAQLRAGGGPVGVAMHWLRFQARGPMLFTQAVVLRWLKRQPNLHLLKALLRWQMENGARWSLLGTARHFDSLLRSDDEAWGEVSYVLLTLGNYRATCEWTRDWADRKQAPVWALGNRCGALAHLRDWAGIDAVVRASLPRAPDYTDLRFWQLVSFVWRRQAEDLNAAALCRFVWNATSSYCHRRAERMRW